MVASTVRPTCCRGAGGDVTKLSPVEASARYLAHMRAAWNHAHPGEPLERQEVVLTLPASFDEIARELTVRAAARAGLPRVVLIEEPQAAFYAWIDAHGDRWQQLVTPGQTILICDIGGGTSDFTLIRVRQTSDGSVQFHRVAVGEHLILGGDNLDLALAHHVERKLGKEKESNDEEKESNAKLDPLLWAALVQSCRQVKETLLGSQAPEQTVINIAGKGRRLIGGALQAPLTRDEVRQLFFDGFLPEVPLDARPAARRSGFQEFGLPYASDSAITRYLASFLTSHRDAGRDPSIPVTGHDSARPDIVLFNGGFFASSALRERLLDVLTSWFNTSSFNEPGDSSWRPVVLDNERLDLAVARGAAYYGMVRRGVGVRIAAGLARTYYVGVETAASQHSAICLLPSGIEEGHEVTLGRTFELLIRQPVEFPLFFSSVRLTDTPGEVLPVEPEQMTSLPPIRTVIDAGKKSGKAESVAVNLHARLTEIGTLDMWCAQTDGPRTWRLQFDIRAATQTDQAAHTGEAEQSGIVDETLAQTGRDFIDRTFGTSSEPIAPEGLIKRLAEALGMPRGEWPPSLLRSLWESACDVEPGRKRSAMHEARWLGVVGYALRPGYGLALDDWRVQQTWRLLQKKLQHPAANVRAEWWILWRRIAGGMLAGQQRALAEPVLAELRAHRRSIESGRGGEFRPGSHEAAELWRALGSFELLSANEKEELGTIALQLASREKTATIAAAEVWAIGRIGARQPTYGPLNVSVDPEIAGRWIETLLTMKRPPETASLALMQLARRTDDRYRDVTPKLRERVATWIDDQGGPAHFVQLVRDGGQLETEEQGLVFGEALPRGLRIV